MTAIEAKPSQGSALADPNDLVRPPAGVRDHRRPFRASRRPRTGGDARLTTVGRRTGRTLAILGFIEDGPNIVVPAMNGWMDPEPAWWLNLQAHPKAASAARWADA